MDRSGWQTISICGSTERHMPGSASVFFADAEFLGRIAQWLMLPAHNRRIQGSSPCAPTISGCDGIERHRKFKISRLKACGFDPRLPHQKKDFNKLTLRGLCAGSISFVAIVQWQSASLPSWMLRVQVPFATPCRCSLIGKADDL